MQYGIAFTPLVPALVLWVALAVIVAIAGLLLVARARGAAIRVTALALVLLALANPSFTREEREPELRRAHPGNRAGAGRTGRQPQKDQGAGGAGGRGRPGRRRDRRHQIVRRAVFGAIGCSDRSRRRRLPDHRRTGARHSRQRGGAWISG